MAEDHIVLTTKRLIFALNFRAILYRTLLLTVYFKAIP